ncbi:MAG: hypothetical protein ACTSWN_07665 [Promethearchaeota archaeon]
MPSIGLLIYYSVNRTAEEVEQEIELFLQDVKIIEASSDSTIANITASVYNPTSVNATTDPYNLTIGYNSTDFGTTSLEPISISPGNNTIQWQSNITITNETHFKHFINIFPWMNLFDDDS